MKVRWYLLILIIGIMAIVLAINNPKLEEGSSLIEAMQLLVGFNENVEIQKSNTGRDGLTYSTNNNGVITVSENNKTIGKYGFGLTGNIGGSPQIRTSQNYTWTWIKTNYSYYQEEYTEGDEDSVNVSYNVDVFTAYNNKANFNWTQVWKFDELRAVKITNILTNNLGSDITNTKFWYINTIEEGKTIRYNRQDYIMNSTQELHLQGNFDNVAKLNFPNYEFRFEDLIDDGFNITDVYIGNGSIIGHSEIDVVGIGITKGNGIFADGATITLDPSSTGFNSPDDEGYPSDQWTNGANIKTSNNADTTEITVGHMQDTSNYSFGLPDGVIILGIEINLEGGTGTCGI